MTRNYWINSKAFVLGENILDRKPVHVLFVDLSSAFDHINRDWLFKSIHQRFKSSQDKTLFNILQAVYSHTTNALADTPNDIFELSTGVRQGGPESPPLYNLYMDYVMRVFEHLCSVELKIPLCKQVNPVELKVFLTFHNRGNRTISNSVDKFDATMH